ncbi:single-stranded DNA-binding protein [Glutamicibacter uratoxydans]|uniref:single-stranded DNA-binding protein n=1 Tax=Glutamicibacter uratoxydans TaxID=43667 RepID=UPI003D6ED59B
MKIGPKTVTGNLAEDPVWRTNAGSGENFLTLKLLETQRVQNRETRQWEDGETIAYDIAVREQRMAQHIANSVHKGDRLTVVGNYQVEPYTSRDGKAGLGHRIYAHEVAASLRFTDAQLPERHPEPKADRQVDRNPSGPQQSPQSPTATPAPAPAPAVASAVNPQSDGMVQSASESWARMMTSKFQSQPSAGHQGPSR